jgi:hypothetical protein
LYIVVCFFGDKIHFGSPLAMACAKAHGTANGCHPHIGNEQNGQYTGRVIGRLQARMFKDVWGSGLVQYRPNGNNVRYSFDKGTDYRFEKAGCA